jgi:hypothetical protein
MAVLVLAAIAVVAAIFVTGRLAVATQDKGEARHGADAAALAGAQAVLDEIPTDVVPGFLTPTEIPVLLGDGRCLLTGYPEASRLAQANGDSLAPGDYCYNSFTDEISVTVHGDDGARAEATAATSFDAGSCRLDPGFTPPSEDPGDSGDDDASDDDDDPLPPVRTLLDCGIADLVVTFNPVDSRFHFVDLGLALADVKPRLTR